MDFVRSHLSWMHLYIFIIWTDQHEVEINWEEICPEKYYKKTAKCTREAQVEMFRFYLQWSKVVQYAANWNEKSGRPKCLQKNDKEMDMGKHSVVLNIIIYS